MRNTEGSIWLTAWTEIITESWLMSNSHRPCLTFILYHLGLELTTLDTSCDSVKLQCYSYVLAPFSDFICNFWLPTPPTIIINSYPVYPCLFLRQTVLLKLRWLVQGATWADSSSYGPACLVLCFDEPWLNARTGWLLWMQLAFLFLFLLQA